MKQTEIIKVLAKDLKAKKADLDGVNQALKAKDGLKIKYRLSGKKLGHYGFTGLIKALTEDGIKVFDVKKVILIPYDSVEAFEQAKPREKRPVLTKPAVQEKPTLKKAATGKGKSDAKPLTLKEVAAALEDDDEDDEDDDDGEIEVDFVAPHKKKRSSLGRGHTGSKYIPKKR